ncbi:MAG: hypothetical protein QOH90_379, partial [Actinomycetota bacterium]|nr:hypothetical protein [Actinomycetota bacterium]
QSGQATLELALGLPVVVVLIAVLVQVGIVVGDQIRVWHAAREAVRVAAVDSDENHVRRAAEAGGLSPLELEVDPETAYRVQGEPVTVNVSFSGSRRVPLLGNLIGPRTLVAEATMRLENP